MTPMKNILFLIITLVSLTSFASGGGGGVLCSVGQDSALVSAVSPSIVFYQGEQNGVVGFTHGTFENGQWQLQNFEVPAVEMTPDSALTKAVEASKEAKNWVEVE